MTRVYYKEAVGAIVVFDVTRVTTFDAVQKVGSVACSCVGGSVLIGWRQWKFDIDAKVQLADGSPIPVILMANKVHTLDAAASWRRSPVRE
jgi:Ras-related protein Rab-32